MSKISTKEKLSTLFTSRENKIDARSAAASSKLMLASFYFHQHEALSFKLLLALVKSIIIIRSSRMSQSSMDQTTADLGPCPQYRDVHSCS